VKGRCLNRLTKEPFLNTRMIIASPNRVDKIFFGFFCIIFHIKLFRGSFMEIQAESNVAYIKEKPKKPRQFF
ncbi:hypothetical protein ACX811_002626, partial [Staphylococcus pseudintermedius]